MSINPFGPYYAGALRTAIASCFIYGRISERQIGFVKEVSAKFREAEARGIMDEVRGQGSVGRVIALCWTWLRDFGLMTQEERWRIRYEEVKAFIEENHRNPSKYVDSERSLRNWVKQQKKLMNAGALEGWRLKMFEAVLGAGERYRRGNQWK